MPKFHSPRQVSEKYPTSSRREFLTTTAFLTAGLVAFGFPWPSIQPRQVLAAPVSKPSGVRYALELQGNLTGPLFSVESGFISGQVGQSTLGPTQQIKKHLTTIVYEDITLQFGIDMSPLFFQWIQQTLNGQSTPMSGAILTLNAGNQIMERIEFQDALIKEIIIPPLSADSKSLTLLGMTIKPAHTSLHPGTGNQISFPHPQQVKRLLASNFRLQIQGLEQACSGVTKIDALVWKQTIGQGQMGRQEFRQSPTGPIETSNLTITLPQSQAEPFSQWFRSFVIQGQASDNDERPGLLEFIDPDMQTTLMTASLGHLGIFRMAPVPQTETNKMALVKVEMYCESIQLAYFPTGGSSATQSGVSSTPTQKPPARPQPLIQPPIPNIAPRLPLKK